MAQAAADVLARRTLPTKLAGNEQLRNQVQQWLTCKYSPEQISHRLKIEFPDDPQMRVSDETIYKTLYIQGRGELRRGLTSKLRTGRQLRRPRRTSERRRANIANMVNISQRPHQIEDRTISGD